MIEVEINGTKAVTENKMLKEFIEKRGLEGEVIIYNGFQTEEDYKLKDGDRITVIKKGIMPEKKELQAMMSARMSPRLTEKFRNASVAVAGLGGLGSNIAVMLARSGIGKLLLIDFDTVEPSNLNRQNYYIKHLGMKKSDAMREIIKEINPFTEVESLCIRLDYSNTAEILRGYKYICEAFDNPEAKAMITEIVLSEMKGCILAASSGMAGIGNANDIKTIKRMKNLYICGDGESSAEVGMGLMAPRVGICAGHQANIILRIIAEEE